MQLLAPLATILTATSVCARIGVLLLASALVGQSPLVTSYSGLGVGAGSSQVFFDLEVLAGAGVTIKSLDVNLTAASLAGTINFCTTPAIGDSYTALGNPVTSGNWVVSSFGTVVAAGVGRPSHVCLSPPVILPIGTHAVCLQYLGVAPQWTTGNLIAPPVATTATAELGFSRGDYQAVPWAALSLPTEVFDGAIHYEIGATSPCITCANKVTSGLTCASNCTPFLPLNVDSNFPVLGEPLHVVTTDASTCAVVGITMFGFTSVLDTPLLVPPPGTCYQHLIPAATVLEVPFGGSFTTTLLLPNTGFTCGLILYVQSAVFESSGDVITSNLLTLTLGS